MIIELIPVVVFGEADFLNASVSGDSLTVNGLVFDFSPLRDGDSLPRAAFPDKWVIDAKRTSGVVHVHLRFPIPAEASHEARFPAIINATDGQVPLPWVQPPAQPQGPGEVWTAPTLDVQEATGNSEVRNEHD